MDFYIKGEKRRGGKGDWFLLIFSVFLLLASAVFFVYTQYPSFFRSKANIEKNENISPRNPVVIDFSNPVISGYFGWKVEIYPKINFNYHFENNSKKLVIYPEEYWLPESEYKILISGKNCFLSSAAGNFSFKTVPYPKLSGFYPEFGAKDVLLDIEDPIKATFDGSISDFSAKFIMSPLADLNYEIDDDNNQINLMPKVDIERGKKYTIDVYLKYKEENDNKYRKIGSTSFETKPVPSVQVWEKDFKARLEQAKKFTESQIKEGKYIDINLKSQIMTIFENGKLLDAYMVSSGKRGMETPEGSYHISNKTPRAWSKEYGLFMPYWQALVPSGAFGIHELPEWPSGYKEGANHLGTPVSHGCVRLGIGPAERVYDWTDIGTPVAVHY